MLHSLQTLLIYIGSFVVVLSVVVTVHELGHFYAARLCRIPVKSFSLGFGPQLLALRDKHDTVWKISAIPLGGFVSWIDDTDPTSTLPATEEQRELSPREQRERGYFRAQPIWARSFVTAAGPLSNFIFSIFAFSLLALVIGKDVTDVSRIPARVGQVAANSAASIAGLKTGDVITAIDGQAIANFPAMQNIILASAGKPLHLQIQRDGHTLTVAATPGRRAVGQEHAGAGVLGVNGPYILPSELKTQPYTPLECLQVGATRVWFIISSTVDYIGKIFTGRAAADQIAGPLGILSVSGQAATTSLSTPPPPGMPGGVIGVLALNLFFLAATLSVAVGFVNVLPIPVLDGGHLLFYGVEAMRGGRPLPPKAQEWAFWTGVSVLLSLFLFATWNDIHHFPGLQ